MAKSQTKSQGSSRVTSETHSSNIAGFDQRASNRATLFDARANPLIQPGWLQRAAKKP